VEAKPSLLNFCCLIVSDTSWGLPLLLLLLLLLGTDMVWTYGRWNRSLSGLSVITESQQ
jgi:hypothetical protein